MLGGQFNVNVAGIVGRSAGRSANMSNRAARVPSSRALRDTIRDSLTALGTSFRKFVAVELRRQQITTRKRKISSTTASSDRPSCSPRFDLRACNRLRLDRPLHRRKFRPRLEWGQLRDSIGNTFSLNPKTLFLGGAQVSFNYEFGGGILVGAEADFDWLSSTTSSSNAVVLQNPTGIPTGSAGSVAVSK